MNRVERLEKALEVAMQLLREYPHIAERVEALLNPPPAYEDVEVVRWAVIAPSGYVEETFSNEECANGEVTDGRWPGYEVAKLTGTRKRPLPFPVEKMTHGIAADGSVVLDIGEQPPKGTPCVVLWEEGGAGKTVGGSAKKSVTVNAALTNMGNLMCARVFKNHKEFHGKKGTLTFTVQEDQ